jgi:undecaprenyl diphosphate synthase
MDGNGRWAERRGYIRTKGHLEGLKTAKRMVKAASDLGLSYLTLYVFSTENWKRTAEEVAFIMGLVKQYLRGELDFYRENRIRIRHTGDVTGLPADIAADLRQACEDTRDFPGLQVILALNYGGRDEIIRGIRKLLATLPSALPMAESANPAVGTANHADPSRTINEAGFRQYLDNPDVPDPDLVIRTAGEMRTSNFLLWEGAYAEYWVTGKLWPDFTEDDFKAALVQFGGRERRYGGANL